MHPARKYALQVDPQTIATFLALVEAIVPRTPAFSPYGSLQIPGAAESSIHEYMIWELDHSLSLNFGMSLVVFPLAYSTGRLLDAAAYQFIVKSGTKFPYQYSPAGGVAYAALPPGDRIRVLSMLERLEVDLETLPEPYRNDGGYVKFTVDLLNRMTLFGNYSEWSGYGSTRLNPPDQRILEYFPIGWRQVGYPGVSRGYPQFYRGMMLWLQHNGGGILNAANGS